MRSRRSGLNMVSGYENAVTASWHIIRGRFYSTALGKYNECSFAGAIFPVQLRQCLTAELGREATLKVKIDRAEHARFFLLKVTGRGLNCSPIFWPYGNASQRGLNRMEDVLHWWLNLVDEMRLSNRLRSMTAYVCSEATSTRPIDT